ncbi:probable 2-oxoglutarate dehydrogenase E1 component DHKTD1 homolog, mitochondrial isoform X1 [Homalodisca vitripennis]|uniref:probable 2-oxoglutarate dehydrogenase E1 component DHKTD1 homolog, mitochondrial isoform X1 n=2 Tax=Homalodisca vitripennis TaxID=197043 RepID=UPI001EEA4653|nr:probable 2-oxoglutarate dehydrogenase E1 component DHKTD1 homolog, mitochondrial isoform X1 [Homalodisca vitripennis]
MLLLRRKVLSICNSCVCKRNYHNRTAVYGFRPKDSGSFKLSSEIIKARCKESQLYQLISAYREHGHKRADINPVDFTRKPREVPELDPSRYGLTNDRTYSFEGLLSTTQRKGSLSEAIEFLNQVYCGSIGGEFEYLQEEEERVWFANRLEELKNEPVNKDFEKMLALEMLKCQAFDHFMAKKFVSLKRYGAEGAESLVAFFLQFFKSCVQGKVTELIIGMPHRGRLNLLINHLHLPPELLFRKLLGKSEFPDTAKASGDVISHLICSTEINVDGKLLQVTSLHNPSHLEAVNPVSMGKTRCRHLELGEGEYGISSWSDKVVNLQVHGDGAIAGQGINQETLLMSRLPHFEVGGSVHLIVNNQVAFTTPSERSRGTPYCSDIAKLIAAPVVHVNGDVLEDVIRATQLVTEYQRKFRKDVFLDLNCYRQRGHNELDDPTFTNPRLYEVIHKRSTIPDKTAAQLKEAGVLSDQEVEEALASYTEWLNQCLQKADSYTPEESYFGVHWRGFSQAPAAITTWDTGCDTNLLRYIAIKSVSYPEHFIIHPTLLKNHVKGRLKRINEGLDIDWSTAEAMAWGSLIYEGYNVRISGQDVGRGTFSHRHVMLVDQETNDMHIPLNNLAEGQATFLEIANSHLSEEAVLGFEYGMSIESPKHLIIWEAQFGDFFNGAQIHIDTFVSSGETKWMRCSGLVMMLPHGYDGAGPEHSSCRLERFLQLSDSSETEVDGEDVNWHIVNPTTPAQYFHLLRRQMVRNYRKPLILVSPKILIRDPEATSALSLFAPGSRFQPVIGDASIRAPDKVNKVLFVCGKHYYALRRQREELGLQDVAIIRVEELCPFPTYYLQQEADKFTNAKHFIWCQEEHQNMGAWTFCKTRFENLLGRKLKYCGRGPLATPAVGISNVHKKEVEHVIKHPFQMD